MDFYYNLLVFRRVQDQQGVSGFCAIAHQALEHLIWILEAVKGNHEHTTSTRKNLGFSWDVTFKLKLKKNKCYLAFSIHDINLKQKKIRHSKTIVNTPCNLRLLTRRVLSILWMAASRVAREKEKCTQTYRYIYINSCQLQQIKTHIRLCVTAVLATPVKCFILTPANTF